MILLSILYAFVYIILATVISIIIAYIFALIVPSPEMVDIMIYEKIMLSHPKKKR